MKRALLSICVAIFSQAASADFKNIPEYSFESTVTAQTKNDVMAECNASMGRQKSLLRRLAFTVVLESECKSTRSRDSSAEVIQGSFQFLK